MQELVSYNHNQRFHMSCGSVHNTHAGSMLMMSQTKQAIKQQGNNTHKAEDRASNVRGVGPTRRSGHTHNWRASSMINTSTSRLFRSQSFRGRHTHGRMSRWPRAANLMNFFILHDLARGFQTRLPDTKPRGIDHLPQA